MSTQVKKSPIQVQAHVSGDDLRHSFCNASRTQIPEWAGPQVLGAAQWMAFWTDCNSALSKIFDTKANKSEAVLKGTRDPVLVLPGFMTDDRCTQILREETHRQGYSVYPWGHGTNAGPNQEVVRYEEELLDRIFKAEGRPVILIGHSQGGMAALALARAFPEKVRQVITLGSPHRVSEETVHVPVTSIYSRADDVVRHWRDCIHPAHSNVEVDGSHIALVQNPKSFAAIFDALERVEQALQLKPSRAAVSLVR